MEFLLWKNRGDYEFTESEKSKEGEEAAFLQAGMVPHGKPEKEMEKVEKAAREPVKNENAQSLAGRPGSGRIWLACGSQGLAPIGRAGNNYS